MDYVVIEYCLTKLWGKNIEERVRHLLLSQFRELLEEKRNVPKAVSYTHLDVYKRQEQKGSG